ncbi:MAG TPA: type II secretion system F family protein [Dehalococcoidia bacterium]|nr:type II secretion system F family protein [Dehalococcoidia bacterium]
MQFKYTATTADGTEVTGVLEAESQISAEEILWDSGLTIINLRKILKLPALHEALPSLFGVQRKDVIQFSRNVASLLDAGIPILRALTIQTRFGKRAFRAILKEVIADLERGSRFSEACAKHTAAFPDFYVYLLRTGEEVGNLSGVLKETATHMERDEALKSKIKKSLAYPSVVLVLAAGAIVLMMVVVVPALTELFSEFGEDLPAMTRILISISDFFKSNILYMIVILAAAGAGIYLYTRTEAGVRNKDKLMIKIPIVGQVILKGGIARFCRNISMMVGAGVSLIDSLKLASETTENSAIRESINIARSKVADGTLFSEAVSADPLFPMLMSEMVAIGEESGALEEQLTKVSGFYEEEAEAAITQLTGMMTPALTILVGGVIAFIAIAIFSSIYGMVDVLPS